MAKVSNIRISKLPYQDHPFVHGEQGGKDVWLKDDGTWTTQDGDPNSSIPLYEKLTIVEKGRAEVKSGVGVIVVRNNKVLVGKRKGSHGAGIYAFPGGHVDPGDKTLAACGEREVKEETGIICRVFNPDHYRQDLFTTYDILSEDRSKVYVTCYLVADYLHGGTLIRDGDKHYVEPKEDKCEGWEWMSLDELAALVQTEEQRTWIPVHQVIYYLKQLWDME